MMSLSQRRVTLVEDTRATLTFKMDAVAVEYNDMIAANKTTKNRFFITVSW